jgi:hypothetical protein
MKRRLAIVLVRVAGRILPVSRREWLRDMRSELEYVKSDSVALEWAVGCVLASLKERVSEMLNTNGKISRPVLVLEWLMCFVPLSLVWFAGVRFIFKFGATADIVVAIAFGALGLIALVAALVTTFSRSTRIPDRLLKVLAGAFALMVVLQLTNAGATGKLDLAWFKFDLSVFITLSLLPLLGTIHLAYLSRPHQRQSLRD